jgi:hypothetical protein
MNSGFCKATNFSTNSSRYEASVHILSTDPVASRDRGHPTSQPPAFKSANPGDQLPRNQAEPVLTGNIFCSASSDDDTQSSTKGFHREDSDVVSLKHYLSWCVKRYSEPEYEALLPALLEAGVNFNFLEKMMDDEKKITGLMDMLIRYCNVKKIVALNLAYDFEKYMKVIRERNIDVAGMNACRSNSN